MELIHFYNCLIKEFEETSDSSCLVKKNESLVTYTQKLSRTINI